MCLRIGLVYPNEKNFLPFGDTRYVETGFGKSKKGRTYKMSTPHTAAYNPCFDYVTNMIKNWN